MNRERERGDREEGERDLFLGLAAWAKPDEACYDVLHQPCVRACRNIRTRIKTTHKHTITHVSIKYVRAIMRSQTVTSSCVSGKFVDTFARDKHSKQLTNHKTNEDDNGAENKEATDVAKRQL